MSSLDDTASGRWGMSVSSDAADSGRTWRSVEFWMMLIPTVLEE